MFPYYQPHYRPYVLLPTMATAYTPLIYQNAYPFTLQGATPHLGFSTASFNDLSQQSPRQPTLAPSSLPSIENRINEVIQEHDSLHSPTAKKEKVIKKQSNRPATYLTQRKYYLTQNLPQDETSGRKLRPRNKKKKVRSHHRNHHKPDHILSLPLPSDNILLPKVQNVDLIPTIAFQKPKDHYLKTNQDKQRMIAVEASKKYERKSLDEISCVVKTQE